MMLWRVGTGSGRVGTGSGGQVLAAECGWLVLVWRVCTGNEVGTGSGERGMLWRVGSGIRR